MIGRMRDRIICLKQPFSTGFTCLSYTLHACKFDSLKIFVTCRWNKDKYPDYHIMDPLALQPVLEVVPYSLKDMATAEIISKPPQNSSTSRLRHQISSEEWEVLRPLIQHLYIEENWTYLHIADFLAKAHGFRPT